MDLWASGILLVENELSHSSPMFSPTTSLIETNRFLMVGFCCLEEF